MSAIQQMLMAYGASAPGGPLVTTGFEFSAGTTSFADGGSAGLAWVLNGGASSVISTSAPIAGTASLVSSAGGAAAPWNAALDIGSADFVFSFQANIVDGYNGYNLTLASAAGQSGAADAFKVYFGAGYPGVVMASVYTSSGTYTITGSSGLTGDATYTIKLQRVGSTITLYLNGTSIGSASIAGSINTRGGGYLCINQTNNIGGAGGNGKYDSIYFNTPT